MQVSPGQGTVLIDDVVVVHDADPSSTSRQSVLVADGRIASVRPASEPDGSWAGPRIEGDGRWLVPGLIDLHIHSTDPDDMACYMANGVTTVRYAGVDSPSVAGLRRQLQDAAATAPRLLSCGPMLDTDPPSWPSWAVVVEDAASARQAATDLLDREGLDALFGVHGLQARHLQPIVEVATSGGVPVVGQLWGVDGREAAALGVRQLDNTSRVIATQRFSTAEMTRPRPVSQRLSVLAQAWVDIDWPRTEAIMAGMVEGGTAYCPTMIVWQYLADGAGISDDPDFETFFTDRTREDFGRLTDRMNESWDDIDRANWATAFENRKEWIRRFRGLGGTIVAGTDMQFGGIALHRELDILVDCGMTPAEALGAATRVAADVASKPELGRIEPGAIADLLLLDADPRVDVRNLRTVSAILQRGVAADIDALRTA